MNLFGRIRRRWDIFRLRSRVSRSPSPATYGQLAERLAVLEQEEKLLERQRLEQRTHFDLEMLREIGFCHGIENYSRHLSGREAGESPPTLLDIMVIRPMTASDPPGIKAHQFALRPAQKATQKGSEMTSRNSVSCPDA